MEGCGWCSGVGVLRVGDGGIKGLLLKLGRDPGHGEDVVYDLDTQNRSVGAGECVGGRVAHMVQPVKQGFDHAGPFLTGTGMSASIGPSMFVWGASQHTSPSSRHWRPPRGFLHLRSRHRLAGWSLQRCLRSCCEGKQIAKVDIWGGSSIAVEDPPWR